MPITEGVASQLPAATNTLPATAPLFHGLADAAATSAALWAQRSMAAGDGLNYRYVAAAGLYLKNGATADAGVNAAGIASGKGLAATLFGATGTTPLLPNAAALADGDAVPTTSKVGAVNYVWDGTNVRLARQVDPAGAAQTGGIAAAGMYLWHAASDLRAARTIGGITDGNSGATSPANGLVLLNGATYDRARTGSAANMSATTQPWGLVATAPGEWTAIGNPATTVAAVATRAAGAAGVRHVCTGVVAAITTGATAQGPLLLTLRDGASGAGTVLLVAYLAAPANSVGLLALAGLHVPGSAATAMTLEFSNASAVGSFQTTTLTGFSVA